MRADHDLAAAHAADRGWARETLEQAARRALAERHPDAEPDSVQLVQVIDRAGTDEDKAVFVADAGGRRHELTLGRRGAWVARISPTARSSSEFGRVGRAEGPYRR